MKERDCDSLRLPFYFQAGWNSEQILHCGIQEEASLTVLCMYLNQLQVETCSSPATGLYLPKAFQSFLIPREKDLTAEYFKAIKKTSEPFI